MSIVNSRAHTGTPNWARSGFLAAASLVLATFAAQLVGAPANADENGSTLVSVTPVRVVDTNTGTGGSTAPLGAGAQRSYTIPGVPSDTTAVLVDVAATSATANSSLRIWPSGESMPTGTSVLAIDTAQLPDSNTVIVPLGSNGKITVWNNSGSVDFNVDLHGYFVPSDGTAGFHALTSERIVDSPTGLGVAGPTISAGTNYDVQVTGGSVPAGATAVFANIKLSSATVGGGLRVGKGGTSLSGLPSALNFDAGITTDSGIAIPLSSNGKLRFYNSAASGTVKIYIDIQGYFAPGDDGAGFQAGSQQVLVNNLTIPGGSDSEITAAGQAGLPSDGTLGSVVASVFVSDWTASGGVSLSDADEDVSDLSNVSFSTSMDAGVGANSTAIVPVSDGGKLVVSNKSTNSIKIRLTIQGWFTDPPMIEVEEPLESPQAAEVVQIAFDEPQVEPPTFPDDLNVEVVDSPEEFTPEETEPTETLPGEGGQGFTAQSSSWKQLSCNHAYGWIDANFRWSIQRKCRHTATAWGLRMTTALENICRGTVYERGLDWTRNGVKQSRQASHPSEGCGYWYHGTIKGATRDKITCHDYLSFRVSVNGQNGSAVANVYCKFQWE